MRWILIFCVMSSMLYGFALVAQEEGPADNAFDRRFALPMGRELTVEGQEMQCFSGLEYLTIIRIDTAYGNLYDWRLKALDMMTASELATASRDKTIFELKSVIKTLKDDREWLTLRLHQSDEVISNQTRGFRLEKYVLWAAVLAEAVTIAVLSFK